MYLKTICIPSKYIVFFDSAMLLTPHFNSVKWCIVKTVDMNAGIDSYTEIIKKKKALGVGLDVHLIFSNCWDGLMMLRLL